MHGCWDVENIMGSQRYNLLLEDKRNQPSCVQCSEVKAPHFPKDSLLLSPKKGPNISFDKAIPTDLLQSLDLSYALLLGHCSLTLQPVGHGGIKIYSHWGFSHLTASLLLS